MLTIIVNYYYLIYSTELLRFTNHKKLTNENKLGYHPLPVTYLFENGGV